MALFQLVGNEVSHNFGIGFAAELRALGLQLLAQFTEILDDPVMDDCQPVRCMRVRIALGRTSMRGPAGVPNAAGAGKRLPLQPSFEIFELALGAPSRKATVF